MSILDEGEANRLLCCDVGSLPCSQDMNRFLEGSSQLITDSAEYFENTIVNAFLDKLKAGVSVPAFPQFRDMNEMFLSIFEGLEKIKGGYVATKRLALKSESCTLPEVEAIRRNMKKISDQICCPFKLRVCVTGPYTLSSFFPYRTSETYTQLGQVLSQIVEKNIFAEKEGRTFLISIDEPLFGMVDDPLIDKGTEGREALLKAWETMAHQAQTRNVESCIHLHCTSDDLFWTIKSLQIVESHTDDPLYGVKATKQRLDSTDKFLKASVAVTDFDKLIWSKLGSKASDEAVGDAWKRISKGGVDPQEFFEEVNVMEKRLHRVIERFGLERVALAGTECGLRGFPNYGSAMQYLGLVSKAVKRGCQRC